MTNGWPTPRCQRESRSRLLAEQRPGDQFRGLCFTEDHDDALGPSGRFRDLCAHCRNTAGNTTPALRLACDDDTPLAKVQVQAFSDSWALTGGVAQVFRRVRGRPRCAGGRLGGGWHRGR